MLKNKSSARIARFLSLALSVTLCLALAATFSGCVGDAAKGTSDAYTVDATALSTEGIEPTDTIVVIAPAQGQAFRLPDSALAYAKAAIQDECYVGIVLADGSVSLSGLRYVLTRSTEAGRAKEVRGNTQDYLDFACSQRASVPGVAMLESINAAANELKAKGSGKMTIIVVTSGVTDGTVATTPELLAADPSQIASQLAANGSIADYSGITVRFYGIGQSTGEQVIPDSTAVSLTAFWRAVVVEGGGEPVFCTDILAPLGSDDLLPDVRKFDYPPDRLVIPKLAPAQAVDLELGEDVLTFAGDLPDFYDADQADLVLDRCASEICAGGYTVTVSGYTADSPARTARFLQDLSEQRAWAVARGLMERGVPESSIVAVKGFGPEGSTSMASGSFDEEQAKLDRKVVLTISAPSSA